ncbi:MAG: helix-turn-helix domain-containing protein [Desulfotomaculales bacterium]
MKRGERRKINEKRKDEAKVIADALRARGLKIHEVAEKVGIDRGYLYRVLQGKQAPSEKTLAALKFFLKTGGKFEKVRLLADFKEIDEFSGVSPKSRFFTAKPIVNLVESFVQNGLDPTSEPAFSCIFKEAAALEAVHYLIAFFAENKTVKTSAKNPVVEELISEMELNDPGQHRRRIKYEVPEGLVRKVARNLIYFVLTAYELYHRNNKVIEDVLDKRIEGIFQNEDDVDLEKLGG